MTKKEKEFLTLNEVAKLFGVSSKTISRWADAGKLGSIRTLGGHRRIQKTTVDRLLKKAMKETA